LKFFAERRTIIVLFGFAFRRSGCEIAEATIIVFFIFALKSDRFLIT